nr:hypothetical protein Iba_chr07aCG4870 [Ipomoea batatas]
MHLHLLQHVNRTAQLFHGHADPWELIVEDMDLYRGCEDFIDAHRLQEDDVLIFRHVGYFKFHFFVIRNKEQLDLPEAYGDGIVRQPAEDGEAIFIPAMSSINLDVGLTMLSGCRTLAIDFIEFCNDESILSNFIFWTESEGDNVDVRHGTFTLTFINVGEFINYGEQHAFLRRILCRHRNVIRYLVFFNYEVGEVHLIAFDKCGMEIMTDYLYDFTIEEYANADAVVVDLRNGVVDELSCVWKRLTQRARPSTEILMWVVSKPPRFLALVMARHRCATRLSKVLYGLASSFMVEALALSLARNSQVKWTL